MTVAELIVELQKLNPKRKVHMAISAADGSKYAWTDDCHVFVDDAGWTLQGWVQKKNKQHFFGTR